MSEIQLVDEMKWGNITLSDTLVNNIPKGWEDFFESAKEVIEKISQTLAEEKRTVWPPPQDVFNAFYMCPDPKAVIVGQDVYHTPNVAYGLAFSSRPGAPVPPSLRNIFKKLREEGYSASTGYLGKWALEGVFLINAALTVPEASPGKHLELWAPFTELLMKYLQQKQEIVWILWGKEAKMYRGYIDNSKNLLLEGGHPSPANRWGGFLEYNYFKPCNVYLKSKGKKEIDWNL